MRSLFVFITTFLLSQSVFSQSELEEILVTAKKDRREFELAEALDIGPDSAELLRKAPGANLNSNGPLTSIAQYRGMFGSRISTHVNGTTLSAGGPNWMDPPLSYAPSAQLESLVVYRGIAPVSAGQETIGGAINATTWSGDFTYGKREISGRIRAGGQSINESSLLSGMLIAANANHRLKLAAFTEQGDDSAFSDGDILPTEYKRHRYDIAYGFRRGDHTFQFDYGRNETGDSGTPSLPMDIQYIDSNMASFRYDYEGSDYTIDSQLYYSEIDHGMSNYSLRQTPGNAAMWRRNIATGENLGFSFIAEKDGWKIGFDGHNEKHNSDIDNPNNSMFFVDNFNKAERQILGVFLERQQTFHDNWLLELGVRYNHVTMDADIVDGSPAYMSMMGMSPGRMLRDNFNNSDRSQSDDNVDWVAKLYYQVNTSMRLYTGLSRKSRSASYQERYIWLPLEATAGLADNRTYTGNLALAPEVAHEIELGFDWSKNNLTISPRLFYQKVDDYIQGTISTNSNAIAFVQMMNAMNGTNKAEPLEFNNVDATLYGFDADWNYTINQSWSLSGVINYVRGKRDDINDNLYRISPFNTTFALNYDTDKWGATIETRLYDKQDNISMTNSEQISDGYALLNLKAYWNVTDGMKLGVSIENITDKNYRDHLGGYNRVMGNPDIAVGERLPGEGRNISIRLDYLW